MLIRNAARFAFVGLSMWGAAFAWGAATMGTAAPTALVPATSGTPTLSPTLSPAMPASVPLPTAAIPKGGQDASVRAALGIEGKTADVAQTPSVPLPPLEENAFQIFVRQAIGQSLPLFGVSLFDKMPSTYEPVQNIPATPDYAVGPGDELLIRVWGALDAELRAVVDRNGQISIPRVGTFSVVGIKAAELDGYIRSKIGRVFRNFEVNVTLGQLRSIQVYVVGHARRPGTYTLSSLSTLVNALFASGGASETGSMRHVQLKRKGQLVAELDLYDFINKGDNRADVRLQAGDVIVIPPAGARVAVYGTVDTPAIYEFKGVEATVAEVLHWGGGLPVTATTRMASLERIQPDQGTARSVTHLNLDEAGQAARLRNGDVLRVYPVSPKFENAVTLRGNVATPLRYRFEPGMRIKDLIPERDALIVADYYQRNNRLTLINEADQVRIQQRVRNTANEVNWDYAAIERLNEADLSTQMIPFNLGKAVLESDPAHNLELKSGDVVTIFSKSDVAIPQARQTRLVNVEGEVNAAGVYQVRPGETLRQLLARAGGVTPQAYLYGTEFTREETRRQQQERLDQAIRRLEAYTASEAGRRLANIGGPATEQATQAQILQQQQQQQLARLKTLKSSGRIALELATTARNVNDLPDLPLQDGDRIHIPAMASFVAAVGAVNNDNALIWKSGRTVEDVLRLAGPTDAADLDNLFLLRADGTVISRNQEGSWLFSLSSRFDGLELMPGDAVVVPEKLDRRTAWTSFVTGLKDWTQILYQMGLGIAAWKVIK